MRADGTKKAQIHRLWGNQAALELWCCKDMDEFTRKGQQKHDLYDLAHDVHQPIQVIMVFCFPWIVPAAVVKR
jgi:hypothetical protein